MVSHIINIDRGGKCIYSSKEAKFFLGFEGKITYVEAYVVSILFSNLSPAMSGQVSQK